MTPGLSTLLKRAEPCVMFKYPLARAKRCPSLSPFRHPPAVILPALKQTSASMPAMIDIVSRAVSSHVVSLLHTPRRFGSHTLQVSSARSTAISCILALFIESVLYGVFAVAYGVSTWILLYKRSPQGLFNRDMILFFATTLMFLLATTVRISLHERSSRQ